ncbi:hypothetical protein PCANC_03000 [Puccinia coronata f. sp. avenae]|uniref:Uncharacterized protein n=1 Tax=Puccinia coronata f. sp. avenae TaxID=200324 RepID=A0A2N5W175_9BASI|nr:hypothetical protein PCANC_03000 [Puccinia coronata f. sp. avenae]
MALVHLSKPPSQRQEPHFYHNLPCLWFVGSLPETLLLHTAISSRSCINETDQTVTEVLARTATVRQSGVRTLEIRPNITCLIMPGWNLEQMAQPVQAGGVGGPRKLPMEAGNENLTKSISNGRGVDRPGFGGLQADVPKCHRCVTLVQFMDCQLMAGADLWRAKLPKVAAEGGIGPPPPSLAASVAAPLEDNYTLRAAKVRSRSRDGSSVGDALTHLGCMNLRLHMTFTQFFIF